MLLQVRQCTVARVMYTLQLAIHQLFIHTKQELGKLLKAIGTKLIFGMYKKQTGTVQTSTQTDTLTRFLAKDDTYSKQDIQQIQQLVSDTEVQQALDCISKLQDWTREDAEKSTLSEIELKKFRVFISRFHGSSDTELSSFADTFNKALLPWLRLSMICIYPSQYVVQNAISMYPLVHKVCKNSSSNATGLVLDHMDALEQQWFASQVINGENTYLDPSRPKNDDDYINQLLWTEQNFANNRPIIACLGFGRDHHLNHRA